MRNPFRRRKSRARSIGCQLVRPTAEQAKRAASLPSANERARELLFLHLTPEQQDTYRRARYIEVIGNHGNRYCLHGEPRVYDIDNSGHHIGTYCSYVAERYRPGYPNMVVPSTIPIDDQVLTHLLLLQTDEDQFRATAPNMTMATLDRGYVHHRY